MLWSLSTGAHARLVPPRPFVILLACCFSLAFYSHLIAQESAATIADTEENWELLVSNPDSNSAAPRVSCAISPRRTVYSLHATFEIDYQSLPALMPGGLQLRLCNDELALGSLKDHNQLAIPLADEPVRWTQTIEKKL